MSPLRVTRAMAICLVGIVSFASAASTNSTSSSAVSLRGSASPSSRNESLSVPDGGRRPVDEVSPEKDAWRKYALVNFACLNVLFLGLLVLLQFCEARRGKAKAAAEAACTSAPRPEVPQFLQVVEGSSGLGHEHTGSASALGNEQHTLNEEHTLSQQLSDTEVEAGSALSS